MPEFQGPQNGFAPMNTTGTGRSRPVRTIPSEFLRELQSAASMVMTREECAALELELEQLRTRHSAAA
ncbi:MAG: hypothetical protein NVSMB62_14090 [Acidobacteriaceae bacterium]